MTARHWRMVAAIIAAVLAIDQLTKSWALDELGDGSTIDIVWTLRFNLAFNTGMAFSRGEGMGPVIGIISIAIVIAVLISLRSATTTPRRIASALIVGGALGNLVDRLLRGDRWFRGAVVDFIDLQWWPIFNIADAAIVVGAIMLAISMSMAPRVTR
jgi:signal peptidase II